MTGKLVQQQRRPNGAAGILAVLIPLSSRFDRVQGELAQDFRDQAHYDAVESEAQAIASGIHAAFRGKGLGQ